MLALRRLFAACLFALLVSVPQLAAAKRVALIVANGRYMNATSLKNPASDARLISDSLRRAGFSTVDLRMDLGKSAMEAELQAFSRKAEGADVAMIYYAGHGIEAGGQNYLIPTDAKLLRDRDLEIEATRLDTLLLMVEGARMKIVVLDACRNNPFIASMQRTLRSRAIGRGLAPIEPEGETLVVYAAKAGATAADGDGDNSPFAQSVAKHILQPGLEISLLFRTVRDDVLVRTGRAQEPFTYGSLSGNAFYFVPQKAGAQIASVQQGATSAGLVDSTENLFWQGALAANSEVAFRDYLKRYPRGIFASLAEQNLRHFVTGSVAVPSTPPKQGGGGTVLSGAAAALPNLGAAFAAPTGRVQAGAGQSAASRFEFAVSTELRRKHTADFVTQIKASNPEVGNFLEAAFSLQDVFAASDKAVAEYGLKTGNLADAMAIFLDTLRDAANGRVSKPTRKQALAVRDQMALVLLATPDARDASAARKQQYADTMILTALLISFSLEAAKSDPALTRNFADEVQAMGKKEFGIDLRAIRMTDEGYRL